MSRRRRSPITIDAAPSRLGAADLYFDRYDRNFPGEKYGLEWNAYDMRWEGDPRIVQELAQPSPGAQWDAYNNQWTNVTPPANLDWPQPLYTGPELVTGDPVTRDWFAALLLPPNAREIDRYVKQYAPNNPPYWLRGGEGLYQQNEAGILASEKAREYIALMDAHGVNNLVELAERGIPVPNGGRYLSRGGGTFFDQLVSFVLSPPVLLIATAGTAMYLAPAAAGGAAAAEGAAAAGAGAAELTAAEWAAGLTAEQIGGGALAEGLASGALTAAEWESVAAGWEGLAAESSLQNVALAEIAGDVATGTLAEMIGSEAAAEMLAQGAAVLGPESALATTWYADAGKAVVNQLVQTGKAQLAAELQREFLGPGEPQSAGTTGGGGTADFYGYGGAGGEFDLGPEGDALQPGFISGTIKKAALPLALGAGLGLLFMLGNDERN